MGGVVGGDGDGHGEPVGIARLGQQLLGLLRVIGVGVVEALIVVLGEGGVDGGAHLGAVALGGEFHDLVHVDGIAQSLADLLIVEGLHVVVQVQGLHQVHGTLQGLVGPLADGVHLVDGQVDGHVHRLCRQGRHQGVGVLKDLEGHLVQGSPLAPVVGKLLHHQVLLHRPGHEPEGPGAHGGGGLVGVIVGDDVHHAHIAEEVGVGLGQGDGDGIAVGSYTFYSRKRRGQGGVHRGLGAGFKGINHVIGGDLFPIVEEDALPQGEGVGEAILRHGTVRGHGGDILPRGGGLHQALVDVE